MYFCPVIVINQKNGNNIQRARRGGNLMPTLLKN